MVKSEVEVTESKKRERESKIIIIIIIIIIMIIIIIVRGYRRNMYMSFAGRNVSTSTRLNESERKQKKMADKKKGPKEWGNKSRAEQSISGDL